jgi:hypothetical protein
VQDIRATEKDKVKVGDCFRGGDVIKGQVVGHVLLISTGFVKSRSYMNVLTRILCRWNDGGGIVAGDAMSQDGQGGEAEVR